MGREFKEFWLAKRMYVRRHPTTTQALVSSVVMTRVDRVAPRPRAVVE